MPLEEMMKKVGKVGGMGALKNMFSGLGGNSESNMPNGMPGSIEEMQKMMGKLPMGGGWVSYLWVVAQTNSVEWDYQVFLESRQKELNKL